MTPSLLRTAVWGLLVGLVPIALLASARYAEGRRRLAEDQAQAFADCRRLAERIRSLREQPRAAGLREQPLKELTRLVDQCAESAGLPQAALVRIEPGSPRRLGKSAYLEQEIAVELKAVTLPRLARFLHAAGSHQTGVRVKRMRWIEPRSGVGEESWGVEVMFAYLIYSEPVRKVSTTSAGLVRAGFVVGLIDEFPLNSPASACSNRPEPLRLGARRSFPDRLSPQSTSPARPGAGSVKG